MRCTPSDGERLSRPDRHAWLCGLSARLGATAPPAVSGYLTSGGRVMTIAC